MCVDGFQLIVWEEAAIGVGWGGAEITAGLEGGTGCSTACPWYWSNSC